MDRKKIFLVSLSHLSCDINGGALPASLPYVRSAYSLNYQDTGGLMLAYSCLSSLAQPILGFLADRHDKPWFMPLGVALAGVGIALLGFLSSYWLIFGAIAISGVGSAFFHPEGARYANRVSGKKKGAGMSFFSIGGNSGFILGPLLVTFATGLWGLEGMGIFAAISITMGIILAIGVFRLPKMKPVKNSSEDMRQAGLSADDPAAAEGDELAAAKVEPEKKNDWRQFSRLTAIIISRAIIFTGCNTFIPLYWAGVFHQPKAAGAFALVIFGAFGVGCNILGGFLSDRYGYRTIIRSAFLLMPFSLAAFAFSSNVIFAWLLLPFLGCALYLPFSAQVVLGQTLLAKNIGFASGVTLGLATTLGGIAQPCLGWIADSWGLNSIFYCLASVSLVGLLFSFTIGRKNA